MKHYRIIRQLTLIILFCLVSAGHLLAQDAARAVVKKARDHIALYHYDQAIVLLRQATQIDPDNWEAFYLAGTVLLRQKKPVEAESFLVKAHQLNSEEIGVQKALGALYINLAKEAQNAGKPGEMNDYLLKACHAYPAGTKIWLSLLENWWQNGEYSKIKQEGDFIVKGNNLLLNQGEDKSLQASLIIVARAYYRENDIVNTERFLDAASRIRHANDELFTMRREIRNRAEQEIKKKIAQAERFFKEGNYGQALEILNTANKMPGARSGEIAEMIDKIENEANLKQAIAKIDDLTRASKLEEALEKLQEASANFPDEKSISVRLKKVSAQVDKLRAEQAKINAAQIEEKKKQLELKRRFNNFIKEAREKEKRGSFDIAVSDYENALKLRPDDKEIPLKIEELKRRSAEAKSRQDSFSVSFAAFENDFKVKKYSAAYTTGKKLMADYEEHQKTVAPLFAETCLNLEKHDEATKALYAIEADDTQKNLYNYVKAMVAYHRGDYNLALEHFSKVKSGFRPDINTTLFWIYLYKYQMGIYILLLAMLFPAIKAGKEILANWKNTSRLKKLDAIKESGDYEANLDFLQERYDREDVPNPKQVMVMLAEALLRVGNTQKAYEMATSLLKKDSRNPNAKRIAGEAALLLEDTSPPALEHIQGLLKIDEARKDVIYYLARTYMQQQADHKLAQDFILKALSLNPNDGEAVIYLADLYIKRQLFTQQSFKIFERATRIAPEVPQYYEAIIENCHRLDNPQEAERWREIAAERFPVEPAFSGQQRRSPSLAAAAPASAMPDYENIGNSDELPPLPEANSSGSSAAGGMPDYENIGNTTPGSYPDYENIGNTTPGGFPDYENIGNEPENPLSPFPPVPANDPPVTNNQPISGPQKVCPHCNTVNSIKEYYCIKCGKPFTG